MPELDKIYFAEMKAVKRIDGELYPRDNWKNYFVEKKGFLYLYRSLNLYPGKLFAYFYPTDGGNLRTTGGILKELKEHQIILTTKNSIYAFQLMDEYRQVILRNLIRCKHCSDWLISQQPHDIKTCSCGCCSVDGGHSYIRRSYRNNPNEDYWELSAYRLEKVE